MPEKPPPICILRSIGFFDVSSAIGFVLCDRRKKRTVGAFARADPQIPPRGVEPLEANRQPLDNKALTENQNPVLSTSLDKILRNYPELRDLVKLWPELPGHIKAAIKALVQTHIAGKD